MAFETVCPERIDLIHKNYRKLCSLLVDVDEWGQVMILNMLTRYARTQFLNPNKEVFTRLNCYLCSRSALIRMFAGMVILIIAHWTQTT